MTSCAMVSPEYVAPEILLFREYDGYAADVWSLGVCLYTMLQGRYPFYPNLVSYLNRLAQVNHIQFCNPQASIQAIDLIRYGMLRADPLDRFTVWEIKQHFWYRRVPVQ
ncbi:uncharacterized protein VTP21DRAFT_428 [Calcarisporiella thermophila]|uniref:uncharacterized protein n=1 Tax=Calcarisporiella thermophila TaxID=911321 RepID=UPI0037437DA1